jgi:hypothetical protein
MILDPWKLWSKPKPLPPKVQETEPLKGFAVHSVDLVGIDGEDFVIAIITDGKDWIQACFPENCVWVCDEREVDE